MLCTIKIMTVRLEQAFLKASTLPAPQQDALAEQLVEDIEGEMAWDQTLASPQSQTLLERMAKTALTANRAGKTHPGGFGEP